MLRPRAATSTQKTLQRLDASENDQKALVQRKLPTPRRFRFSKGEISWLEQRERLNRIPALKWSPINIPDFELEYPAIYKEMKKQAFTLLSVLLNKNVANIACEYFSSVTVKDENEKQNGNDQALTVYSKP